MPNVDVNAKNNNFHFNFFELGKTPIMTTIDSYKRNNEEITLKIIELILRYPGFDISIKYEKI